MADSRPPIIINIRENERQNADLPGGPGSAPGQVPEGEAGQQGAAPGRPVPHGQGEGLLDEGR